MRINIATYLNGKATTIIRYAIVAMLFISCITLQGMQDLRLAHQIVFMLAIISLFSLILRNIWITLFLLWTVFLYSFFKFTTGSVYLSYVFFGCAYYLITKVGFKKEHINIYINGFLWFVFANVAYMTVQICGFDFIFSRIYYPSYVVQDVQYLANDIPYGFMSHMSILSTVIALGIPLLASRGSKWSWIGALGLFLPLYIAKTSLCFLMGGFGLLFILYFRIPKRVFIIGVVLMAICGSMYLKKVDRLGTERFVQWHNVMRDAMIHPVTGWGLGSFANITPQKDFRYAQTINQYSAHIDSNGRLWDDVKSVTWWDNPHNLIISIFYEWGCIGLFLFIGYLCQYANLFRKAIKDPNTIALAGFILVVLGVSMGHFPLFLARTAVLIIPAFALFEVATNA